jgi:16S rRNA (guanine527-N7)-methyltransferase
VPRLWDRHILNCAVIADVIPADASVIDVGSGAGLPGLCLAIARPDLQVTLVEPMERRTDWLNAVRADLALANVRVVRARAEELHGELEAGVVTARAVAPLDKLARWCLPLVRSGGRLVAMKGSSAEREIAAAERTMRRLGGAPPRIEICGAVLLSEPTRVVIVEKTARPHGPARRARSTTRR